jgi:hypothetical protein
VVATRWHCGMKLVIDAQILQLIRCTFPETESCLQEIRDWIWQINVVLFSSLYTIRTRRSSSLKQYMYFDYSLESSAFTSHLGLRPQPELGTPNITLTCRSEVSHFHLSPCLWVHPNPHFIPSFRHHSSKALQYYPQLLRYERHHPQ